MSGKPDDLASLCRLCLHPGCVDIFDKEIPGQQEVDLSSKIMACVSVKITPFDPGPQKICGRCMHHIDTWFQFKEECTKVDSLLQTLVAELSQSSIVEDRLNLPNEHSLLDISLSSFDLSLEKHLNSPTNLSPFLDCYLNSTPEKTYSLDDSLCAMDTSTEYAQQNAKHPNCTATGYLNEINFNHQHANIPLLTTVFTLCPRISNADSISEQDAIESESDGNIKNGKTCTNKQTKESSGYLSEINFNHQHANTLLLTKVSNVDNISGKEIESVGDIENGETCTNRRKKESSSYLNEINFNHRHANIPLLTTVTNVGSTVSNTNNIAEQDTIESVGNIENGKTCTNEQKKERYQCELCGSTFPRFVNLLNHDDTVHETIPRQYSCSVCQRLFICENRLKTHILSHREKLFKCTTCEKAFSSKQSLLVHTRLHTEKYKCDTCGFVSTSKVYLEAHQNKHTGNETVYNCKICSSSFTRRSSLQRHENVHLKHRDITLKQFNMNSNSPESMPKKRSRSRMRSDVEQKTDDMTKSTENINSDEEYNYVKRDIGNIVLLLFLYLLQGIPLGLSAAIPIILQNRGIRYSDQAEFSFVLWPFSMKLLWAPLVDSIYSSKFGRRKSWLIPTQLLIGFFMMLIAMNVDHWLGDESGNYAPNIRILTAVFFACNFLAATQDIAVDGWALTMLHRKNIGHASTCNSVGQTAGFFFGYVLFIALDSADFCNKYLFWLRPEPEPNGIISFSTFMYFWGIVFLISTTLVAIFKKDNSLEIVENNKDIDLNIKQSYELLWEIMKLKPVQITAVILLTVKLGFAACDNVAALKLVENGVPKTKLALIAVPLIPLQVALPFMISRYIVGPRPMDCYLAVIPYRLLVGLFVAALVYFTPYFKEGGDFPYYFYGILLVVYGLHQMVSYIMYVAVMAFFAKVSDPRSGGTYMTLLNTLSNLGGTWPSTVILWLVDVFTWKKCEINCKPDNKSCCTTYIDGFFVEIVICTIIGVLWILLCKRKVDRLQNLGDSAWLVDNRFFCSKN